MSEYETTETTTEEKTATPTPRDDVVLADGSTLDDANKLRDDADGTVELEDGKLVDAPANQPGGQHDTNAGNADSGHDPVSGANITGTVPVGTPADDQPDLRPTGADGNVLETPDAPGTDPSVTTLSEQPDLQAPDTGDTVDNTAPAESVVGSGDSTDDNA